jgi:uncharacterized protein YukE
MPGNLDAFHQAESRLKEVEKRMSALVQEVNRTLAPLFEDWRRCYPITSPADTVPSLLIRVDQGGAVQRLDVANLPNVWKQMQRVMEQYAEAKQEATAALERLSPEQIDFLSRGLPGKLTDRAQSTPNRFCQR